MPTPLRSRVARGVGGFEMIWGTVLIVNALAPGLNTMLFTSVFGWETETLVVLDVANVAVSDGPLGIV